MSDRVARGSKAVAVAAFREDVQLGRNLRILQCQVVVKSAFHGNGVVLGLHEEGGRSIRRDGQLGRDLVALVFEGQICRIHQHGEIRPAAHLICAIHRFVAALVEPAAGHRRQVAAGGEAENADPIGRNMPLARLGPHQAQRALGILQGRFVGFLLGATRDPVFEQHTGNADGVEPVTHLCAFQVVGQYVVTAAWANQHSRPAVPSGRRGIDGDGGVGDVAQSNHPCACDHVVAGSGRIHLRAGVGLLAGCPLGPEGNWICRQAGGDSAE